MLLSKYHTNLIEAGCDEAGRGCLAGPVFAAAVILPEGYDNELINDSKKLTRHQREHLRTVIEHDAVAWAVAQVDNEDIDRTNILRASMHAMNIAVQHLAVQPEALLIDGNRFYNETALPYHCIVKGDSQYLCIAAASILAKTHRDEFMQQAHRQYPQYGWDHNAGYPTRQHYQAIETYGITPLHRKSFKLDRQLTLPLSFDED